MTAETAVAIIYGLQALAIGALALHVHHRLQRLRGDGDDG